MKTARILLVFVVVAILALGNNAQTALAQGNSRVFFAILNGDQEVPPRATAASGSAVFKLNGNGTSLKYRLAVQDIENVVAAHIHLGPPGVNGPVVAFLYGSVPPAGGPIEGVIAKGRITAADLVGPLAGQSLDVLIENMRMGNTYVNVHTNDGVDPINTGPGDFPGGEIRGLIMTR
jgi:hypothetical protein